MNSRFHRELCTLTCVAAAFGTNAATAAGAEPQGELPPPAARRIDFASDIQPILARACYSCHGPKKRSNGLRLDEKKAALRGGELGPDIIPGQGAASPLVRLVAGLESDMPMPPRGPRLTRDEIGLIRAWIDQGAAWPDGVATAGAPAEPAWWSLRPLVRAELPALGPEDEAWALNPIDRFIRARQHEHRLAPAPEADRRTLIRRLTFDLLGLPPAPDAVEAFVQDDHPRAYERLVDRLLASPRHGERWARHWLDVVHYGDSHGYDKDQPRPNAWPYRDYVIRSLNEDKPYGRFIAEQIAGDVLFPNTRDGVEGLGFIAAGPWDQIGHKEVPESKVDGKIARLLDRDDMVANTMNTFVSMTVQCARCHDHKFDPVTQEDYYSLQAVFAALDRADRDYDHDPVLASHRAALRARERALEARRQALTSANGGEADEALADVRRELAAIKKQVASLPKPDRVYCGMVLTGSGNFKGTGAEGGKPRVIAVLGRGDVREPRQVVGPGTVPIIDGVPARFALLENAPEGERRAALARWVCDPRNPLTWRSIVNRVWQYHFGRGIVDSANDFGRMGQTPSHPELLDWLATWFRDDGQSLKRLHRLIVTSATYRQSSGSSEAAAEVDQENALLWRMNRHRLDAEEVRDALLAVAGRLDDRMGGPGFQDFVIERPEHSPHYEYRLHDPEDPRSHRRSIYRFIVRSQPQPFLTTLDCADPSTSVARRNQSITALQALAMLNNRLVLAMSVHFAARLEREAGTLPGQIDRAYRLALGRPPTDAEQQALVAFSARFGLPNACRVLFNLNEFVFLD
jgi:mono/diheme cytochrome c family protein